jgi:restriction system protein
MRERIRLQKEQERQQMLQQKVAHHQYLVDREEEADDLNRGLRDRVGSLQRVFETSLSIRNTILFTSLRRPEQVPAFRPPAGLIDAIRAPNRDEYIKAVQPIRFFEKVFGRRARHERELHEAVVRFDQDHSEYLGCEAKRAEDLKKLQENHDLENERLLSEIRQQNRDVDGFERAYQSGDPSAVIAYCSMVLERSRYPEGFPQEFRIAYVPEPKELVIDYELPTVEVIPTVLEYRYVKSKDAIEEKARKASEVRDLYQDLVAAAALRAIHEVIDADQANSIDVVVFNGFVQSVDLATGKDIKPYLISVRVTTARFKELDLTRIDKKSCLRNLGAQVSPRAAELSPVKPLVEFDMVDRRFVEEGDVLADLESRPNLMDLTPFEFETLVSNLFSKMGLDTKQTRSSRDGGVDAVAFDTRPIIGGKVVIQAKRYRHPVGVSAVRDLFGTMNHEGANKGILVTTSSYGPDAYDFIKGKPIELIDGGGLLYYLEQRANVKARIVFPIEG